MVLQKKKKNGVQSLTNYFKKVLRLFFIENRKIC